MKILPLKNQKQLTPTNVILFVIALILFFGLFKKEIPEWTKYYLPSIVKQIDGSTQIMCMENKENPKWKAEMEKVYREVTEKCFKEQNNHYSYDCMMLGFDAQEEISIPQTVTNEAICYEPVYKWWFYAFGRYWFKLGF
ncbi:MAG: hypothetical protein Q7T54_04925 [Candidatus Levybacteria bacterium]|nr:hypothetical protein [Candidatus Levybacteria bacterium]